MSKVIIYQKAWSLALKGDFSLEILDLGVPDLKLSSDESYRSEVIFW